MRFFTILLCLEVAYSFIRSNRAITRFSRITILNLQPSDLTGLPFSGGDEVSVLSNQNEALGFELSPSNLAIILVGCGFYFYEQKPRGSCRDDVLEVKRSSNIPNNLGVVAKTFIPKETVLGSYPGYLQTFDQALSSSKL